ncbi:MAG: tRNA 2-thiouridine(34) synthase MnmA [Candidatus Peribacteraceae bacterium]|nr:tRNA 2-thiouridine(34) synthase MnmA [Candidatus Peribacteraceae bacterium]
MKILLAMSGGIDSSVVAHLLREQGHDVLGVRFNLWTDPLAPALAQVLPTKCCTTQNISRASNVAKKLGIPLTIIDLEQEFKETVVDPFLDDHKKGLTPNPCIGCNRNIKFGKLLTLAQELGCDRLATGHYARTAAEEMTDGTERMVLLESVDKKKDQSYYLYGLTQEQLKLVSFPLGGMLKSEVYQLAEHFGVPVPDSYRESQDLCFFPEKTPDEFLKRHLGASVLPGEITRKNGVVVGRHEGLPLYTVGQRRGLGVGGLKVPLEVVEKDTFHNRLIVADRGSVKTGAVQLSDMRFVAWKPQADTPLPFECRVRSLSAKKKGDLTITATGAVFRFSSPQGPQAPGQSLVLYRGEEVVGGGVMERGI